MMFLHVGFQNSINTERIVTIVAAGSAPSTRAIREAREAGKLIDCTHGRRTRSLIFMDSGHLVLSPVQPESLGERWMKGGRSR